MSLLDFFPAAKAYVYGGIVVAAIGGFTWYTLHERSVQHTKDLAADAKVELAAKIHNADVQALAALTAGKIGDVYVQALAAVPVDSPHVVCRRAADSLGQLPEAASGNPAVQADATADSAGSDTVDIGPPLNKIGADADAQIKALQADVQLLVDEMNGKTK